MAEAMAPFLRPASVAVVGGSDDPTRIGGRPIRYLLDNGYPGAILPVNPRRAVVQGLPSVPTVADLAETPDLAVIAVGRDQVEEIVRACGARGIANAIVFAAGFAEAGDEGRLAQDALARTAREAGVRLLGPNSNGAMSIADRSLLALTPILAGGLPPDGRIAVATQSAAVGTYWLRRMRERGLGLRYWVHTGNEIDIDLADVMEEYLEGSDVRTILCVVEQWRRPERLPAILERIASSETSVVVLPLGRTEVGRRAALSHTGTLVARHGDVVAGMLRQAGAIVVETMAEAIEIAGTIDVARTAGPRVGVLTSSGGLGVLLADAFVSAGFELPIFRDELQARWRELVPFCSPANPVDVTAQVVNEPELFLEFARDIVTSGQVDVLAAFLPHAVVGDARTRALKTVAPLGAERGVVVAAVGMVAGAIGDDLRGGGVAVFEEPEVAASVLARLRPALGAAAAGGLAGDAAATPRDPAGAPRLVPPGDGGALTDEFTLKSVLGARGLPVVTDALAENVDEAVAAADRLGYPLVMKRHRPGVAHKAADGGVVVGIADRTAAEAAARDLLEGPSGAGAAVLVEPLILGDEVFAGVARDADWGPLALLGVGGVSVEAAGAMAFRRLPLHGTDAGSMLEELPALAPLFARGARRRAVASLGAILGVLGAVLDEQPALRAIELNPVIVQPDGRVVIVDALAEWA